MLNLQKGTLIGIGGGVVVWLILFLPITALLVHPAINDIVILSAIESKHVVFSVDINQSIRKYCVKRNCIYLIFYRVHYKFIGKSFLFSGFFME